MPARKAQKDGAGTDGGRRSAADEHDAEQGRVADELRRFLNPLGVMLITRDRLQEALDDAVQRGRMTRDDAGDLLAELIRRGRRQTEDILAELEGLLEAPTDRVKREVDRARRAAGLGGSFPIMGYDELTASQVAERLRDLSPAELREVRDHERRNANRKSVLQAIERRLG